MFEQKRLYLMGAGGFMGTDRSLSGKPGDSIESRVRAGARYVVVLLHLPSHFVKWGGSYRY